ncbi:uncharacterized [Tachysurus ichikawai]
MRFRIKPLRRTVTRETARVALTSHQAHAIHQGENEQYARGPNPNPGQTGMNWYTGMSARGAAIPVKLVTHKVKSWSQSQPPFKRLGTLNAEVPLITINIQCQCGVTAALSSDN